MLHNSVLNHTESLNYTNRNQFFNLFFKTVISTSSSNLETFEVTKVSVRNQVYVLCPEPGHSNLAYKPDDRPKEGNHHSFYNPVPSILPLK